MEKLVADSMTRKVITIGWDERIQTAYRRMRDQHIRHLPVMDEQGKVVGILSDRDIQRAMISTIERGDFMAPGSESLEFDPEARVRDYMSWPVKSVDQNTDLRLVAEKMIQEKISALLVNSGKTLLGIVTAEDLLKVLVELLADPKTPARWTLTDLLEQPMRRLDSTLF